MTEYYRFRHSWVMQLLTKLKKEWRFYQSLKLVYLQMRPQGILMSIQVRKLQHLHFMVLLHNCFSIRIIYPRYWLKSLPNKYSEINPSLLKKAIDVKQPIESLLDRLQYELQMKLQTSQNHCGQLKSEQDVLNLFCAGVLCKEA